MDVSALINLAIVGSDPGRVTVSAVDPVDIPDALALGLAGIVSELVENATRYSPESEMVDVSASADSSGYLIRIVDRGLGVADDLLARLNSVLASTDGSEAPTVSPSGIPLVASLASRHGISVRLEDGAPGLTARVTIPDAVMGREDPTPAPPRLSSGLLPEPPSKNGRGYQPISERSEAERMETESFLESVFSPLRDGSVPSSLPSPEKIGTVLESPARSEPEGQDTASRLAMRVPGESYDEQLEEVTHTTAGEAAVEIRSALTDFDRGRRSASSQPGTEGTRSGT